MRPPGSVDVVTSTARPSGHSSLLHGLLRVGADIAVVAPPSVPDQAIDIDPAQAVLAPHPVRRSSRCG